MVATQQVWENMTCRLTTRMTKLEFDSQKVVVNIYTLMLLFTRRSSTTGHHNREHPAPTEQHDNGYLAPTRQHDNTYPAPTGQHSTESLAPTGQFDQDIPAPTGNPNN
jgi:hypothetical protein